MDLVAFCANVTMLPPASVPGKVSVVPRFRRGMMKEGRKEGSETQSAVVAVAVGVGLALIYRRRFVRNRKRNARMKNDKGRTTQRERDLSFFSALVLFHF